MRSSSLPSAPVLSQLSFSPTPLSVNRPHSKYQYSNMASRLSVQTSIFGDVFFVSKSLLGIKGPKKSKVKKLQFCPESLGAMLEY